MATTQTFICPGLRRQGKEAPRGEGSEEAVSLSVEAGLGVWREAASSVLAQITGLNSKPLVKNWSCLLTWSTRGPASVVILGVLAGALTWSTLSPRICHYLRCPRGRGSQAAPGPFLGILKHVLNCHIFQGREVLMEMQS